MRVLIVDDQVSVAKGLQHACKRKGWVAELAFSAEEARALLREKRFDGVVSDLRMPGLSGLDLAKEILGRGEPALFFVLISAYVTLEDSLQALRLGVSDVFQKPFDTEALVQRLEELGRLKGMTGKVDGSATVSAPVARWVKGWDEFFCVQQKVSGGEARWTYFSFPKKNGTSARVGLGFDCSRKLWAHLEGVLLLSLEQEIPLNRLFDFLKSRGSDLGWSESLQGFCVMDLEGAKFTGFLCGNLRAVEDSKDWLDLKEMEWGEGKSLRFSPRLFQGESPVFVFSRKPAGRILREVDLENESLMEALSFFGECLAQGKWDYAVQMRSLSSLAEVLTLSQGWGLKRVRVCLDHASLHVEGEGLTKRWEEIKDSEEESGDLIPLPGPEEFLKRLTGADLGVEGESLCFSVSRGDRS